MKNKLQKLLGVIALAYRFLKNNILFGNTTKYLVGGKFKKPTTHTDLIDINTIDIGNLKTIDDVLDYVNQIGKERFTNGSISDLMALVIFNKPREPNQIGYAERLYQMENCKIIPIDEPEPENPIKQLRFLNREIIVSDISEVSLNYVGDFFNNILIELNEPLTDVDSEILKSMDKLVVVDGKHEYGISLDSCFIGNYKIVLIPDNICYPNY